MTIQIEYGHGSAAIILDRRGRYGPDVRVISPSTDELPWAPGSVRYYESRSGLSGAWRLPSRPYLLPVETYRDVREERPTANTIGPRWPVDTTGTDPSIPVIYNVIRDPISHEIEIYASDPDPKTYIEVVVDDDDTPWGVIWTGAMPVYRRVGSTWEATRLTVSIRGPAGTRVSYEWRRLAWRIARQEWAGMYGQYTVRSMELTPMAETGELSVLGICRDPLDARAWLVRDRDGLVIERFELADHLHSWLTSEPDHQGLGLLRYDGDDAVVVFEGDGTEVWAFSVHQERWRRLRETVDWSKAMEPNEPATTDGDDND